MPKLNYILFISLILSVISANVIDKDKADTSSSNESAPIEVSTPSTTTTTTTIATVDQTEISSTTSPATQSSTSSAGSSSTASPVEQEQEITTERRQIIYDQRQEGKYNIRADLENFMIVVIPPSPTAGLNLLDFLARSSTKRSGPKKPSKRHPHISSRFGGDVRGDQHKFNFFNQIHHQQRQSHPIGLDGPLRQYSEFIEGRTPYRVDISSAENDFGKIAHPEPQVDVLPPPYPLQLHFMKPYQLEAEPVLPPHHSPILSEEQGKLMELFKSFGVGNRLSKTIRDQSSDNSRSILTNSILNGVGGGGDGGGDGHYQGVDDIPIEPRTFVNLDDSTDYDKYSSPFSNFDSVKSDNTDNFYRTRASESKDQVSGNWELRLIGATEQCGPDRVRDSYGVCQFAPDLV